MIKNLIFAFIINTALLISMPASSNIIVQNTTVVNRCPDPLSFGVFYPQTNIGGACSLGGTVNNPDTWPYICTITGIGLFDPISYNDQDYDFNSHISKSGAACMFVCDTDPVAMSFKCISNSIGKDATIEIDIENNSITAP
ncbi:MAG: hypothetical protein GY804_00235 [Alphaproteobacteria bacterium]|nr:hypothetical protein [Alphaproteobacteria bacterium]